MKNYLEEYFSQLPKTDLETVDVGNTHISRGSFIDGKLQRIDSLEEMPAPLSNQVISSVRKNIPSSFEESLLERDEKLYFQEMPLNYTSTIGHDRLIAAYFAFHFFDEPVAIIDAGTFITVDFVSKQGFEGGTIFPGFGTIAKSYERGSLLKAPKLVRTDLQNTPHSTEEAIQQGFERLVRSLEEDIKKQTLNRVILLTGGQRDLFKVLFKKSIIVPELLHLAMYFHHTKTKGRQ